MALAFVRFAWSLWAGTLRRGGMSARAKGLLSRQRTWLLFALAGISVLLGAWRGTQIHTNLDPYIGESVQIAATVSSVHAVRGGYAAVLIVRGIEPVQAGMSQMVQGAYAKVTWLLWGHTGATLAAGDKLDSRGFIALPPVTDAKGKPLRAQLAAAGIRYEWTGRLQDVQTPPVTWVTALSRGMDASLQRNDPARKALQPLLESIVFGGSVADKSLAQQFLAAGLLHVLAASGANILVVMTALEHTLRPLARWCRCPAWLWACGMLLAISVFTALCGNSPSIVRAALMASYRTIGQAFGRHPGIWESTLLAFLVMTWLQAAQVTTSSSVLSFAATAAVAMALVSVPQRPRPARPTTRWRAWVRNGLHGMGHVVWITVIVELCLLPLTVLDFGQITPYAVLSNAVADPLLTVLLPLAVLYIATASIATWLPPMTLLCHGCGWLLAWLLGLVLRWVRTVSLWPGAILTVAAWPTLTVVLYYAVVVCLLCRWPRPDHVSLWYNHGQALYTRMRGRFHLPAQGKDEASRRN